ncbi:hypothetical protein IAU60_005494 [Kwoniella sp. DSM 27419]
MSQSPPPADRRRGGRERKQVERFEVPSNPTAKRPRKSAASEEELEDSDLTEQEESEDDVPAPTRKKRQAAPSGSRRSRIAGNAQKKQKAAVTAGGQGQGGPEGIKSDSSFFNALLSPDIALQPLVDEWVETYSHTGGDEVSEQASVYELVLFIVRSCGLNCEIEQAEATDADGILDVVERIQDETVQVTLASYPLIARTRELKPFKSNLNLFLELLIKAISLTPLLFETSENTQHSSPLINLLLNWLNCMSTSPLRPIRHTATYMTLKLNSALCDVAADVSKDLSLKQRQRDAEVKKAGTTAAAQKRVKDAEAKVKEAHERKQRCEESMQEVFDVMFVHRVRDADPAIRTDCLRELGVWVKEYPEYYVQTSFLTYFTRGCNDSNHSARLETVKALNNLYARDSFMSNARNVTMRLAPRLVEMALRDIDLSVRVTAINVITSIDKTGILADEDETQREKVARLVFDQEPRIRRAVGGFVVNLWEERKETLQTAWSGARANKKKRAAKISEDDMANNLSWKALASLLLETSQSLDGSSEPGASTQQPLIAQNARGGLTRASAAVEAICNEYELWKDWEGLVDYLLLDHSTATDDMWLLGEDEEAFMLEMLVALIAREDKDEDEDDRTKTLIKVLPRLFSKHQSDATHMIGILSIIGHMNLSLYLDMRKGPAYDALWDDITKQFLNQSDPAVMTAAIQAANHLMSNASMTAANDTKITELQEALFNRLRDFIGSDDVSILTLEDTNIPTLEAILCRLWLLERSRDMVEVMEDTEAGQSSGWDIVCAFAERARLGYKEEAKVVEYAMQIVFLHMTWLFKKFTTEDANNEESVSSLRDKRDKAIEIMSELTLGESTNTVEVVSRQALVALMSIHILFFPRKGNDFPAVQACPLHIEDETQHRLGGVFQAAVEKFASDRQEVADEDGNERAEESQDYIPFLHFTAVFVSAIRCGVLDIDHAKEPLAYYGRLTPAYDSVVRKLVDVLRDEGIHNGDAETVQHIAAVALQKSFNHLLDSDAEEPTATVALAKVISTAFTIHGNHFSILRQMNPSDVVDFHMASISYAMKAVNTYINQEKVAKKQEQKSRCQRKRFVAFSYFKALILLLGPITGKDALSIKHHLDQEVTSLGLHMGPNKGYEPYRAYDRKLVAIAARDDGVKTAANKQLAARQAVGDTDHEEDDHAVDREETPTRVVGRPRSNTLTRGDGHTRGANGADRSSPLSPAPISEAGEEPANPATPRKRQRESNGGGVTADLGSVSPPAGADFNDEDLEVDLAVDGDEPEERERSLSVEPSVKRRKTIKRY